MKDFEEFVQVCAVLFAELVHARGGGCKALAEGLPFGLALMEFQRGLEPGKGADANPEAFDFILKELLPFGADEEGLLLVADLVDVAFRLAKVLCAFAWQGRGCVPAERAGGGIEIHAAAHGVGDLAGQVVVAAVQQFPQGPVVAGAGFGGFPKRGIAGESVVFGEVAGALLFEFPGLSAAEKESGKPGGAFRSPDQAGHCPGEAGFANAIGSMEEVYARGDAVNGREVTRVESGGGLDADTLQVQGIDGHASGLACVVKMTNRMKGLVCQGRIPEWV